MFPSLPTCLTFCSFLGPFQRSLGLYQRFLGLHQRFLGLYQRLSASTDLKTFLLSQRDLTFYWHLVDGDQEWYETSEHAGQLPLAESSSPRVGRVTMEEFPAPKITNNQLTNLSVYKVKRLYPRTSPDAFDALWMLISPFWGSNLNLRAC